MPNWCSGNLKVRGKFRDIKRMLTEEFFILDGYILDRKYKDIVLKEEEDYLGYFEIEVGRQGMWLKGARGCFNSDILVEKDIESEEDEVSVNLGLFESAWDIPKQKLMDISDKHSLDFKIFAYEGGMEFNVDFEVSKGEIIKNDEITYDDYEWECPEPNIGG